MFKIINFGDFKEQQMINEGLGSNVFKLDPDRPDSPDHLGKFTFTVKAQYPEGASESEIGGILTRELTSQLQASTKFMSTLNNTKGMPVIYTRRNTTGGFLTGERGVMVGTIVLLDPKKVSGDILSKVPGFRPAGSDVEAMIGSQKLYDGEAFDAESSKITGSSSFKSANLPNYNPNAPVLNTPGGGTSSMAAGTGAQGQTNTLAQSSGSTSGGQAGTSAKTEVNVQEVITGLIGLKYNTSSNQIRVLNGCLIILKPDLVASLVEFVERDDPNNPGKKIKDGLDVKDTYDDSTAKAIGEVLGKKEPIKVISDDVAKALSEKIIPITKTQFNQALLQIRTGTWAPAGGKITPVAGTSGTSGTAGTSAEVAATPDEMAKKVEELITGLKKGTKSPNVGVLQLLVSNISNDAKSIINSHRGIDKQYGGGTASAVSLIITGNSKAQLNSISAETAAVLSAKIKKFEPAVLKKFSEDAGKILGTGTLLPYKAQDYTKEKEGASGTGTEKELQVADTGTDNTSSTGKTGSAGSSEESQTASADTSKNESNTADSLSKKIQDLFKKDKAGNNSSFWKEAAESEGNDFVEEDKAVELFKAWWNKNIEPYSSKFSKAISLEFSKSVSFDYLKSSIATGLDSLSSSTVNWTVDSSKKAYSVDTNLELNQYKPKQNIPPSKQSIDNSYNYGRIM